MSGPISILTPNCWTAAPTAGTYIKNLQIEKGTDIATFIHGVYPSAASGNRAALYDSQDPHGIWVSTATSAATGFTSGSFISRSGREQHFIDLVK
jgi:hypothetical protein